MSPAQSLWHTLGMLWSGQGLAQTFAWLPAAADLTLALWLPRLFRLAVIALGIVLVYALTAHKAQGASVERAYVLAHESLSAREWSYVAGSRAREAVHLYAERSTANDLERIMNRSYKKDTALDYLPAVAAPAATRTPVALER
jgi:hypothetical protein